MKSGTENSQSGTERIVTKLSKTHSDFWTPRLKKRKYEHNGKTCAVPDWSVRICYRGRREWFNTRTPNKAVASGTASQIYLSLVAHGWEKTLAQFKPDMVISTDAPTVGAFLARVRTKIGINTRVAPQTFEIYQKKFRCLVADVFNIEGSKAKFYHAGDAYKKWLERVHGVKLARLTPQRVNEWKDRQLETAGSDALKLKQATNTVRSVLLNAKSLFSDDFRKDLGLPLPNPLPFDGVEIPRAPKNRYKSKINPGELLRKAQTELAANDPEAFKVILLTIGAGLRRDEVDKLPWENLNFHKNTIIVETTEHGATKSDDSENDVSVDPGLMELLKGLMPKPGEGGHFVIQSRVAPRPQAVTYHHYRCNGIFKRVLRWLKGNGVTARHAIHTLRKEYGSQVCATGGIYSASRQLRHSSIVLTREYYTDTKPAVFEISKLLNEKTRAASAAAS